MIFPRLLLSCAAALWLIGYSPGRAADAGDAGDASAPDTRVPRFTDPEFHTGGGPTPITDAALASSGNDAPSVAADAPSGTEESVAAQPYHAPDLPPKTDSGQSVSTPPSPNVTMNLINLMVKRGLLTKEDAQGLMQQATMEAAQAQAAQAGTAIASNSAPAATPATPADSDDTAVNYVPDVVKNQIRDDVTASVMKQAREEGWAKQDDLPEWVHRFHVIGDLRLRYQGDYFPTGNDTQPGAFVNYNSINTGAPFDLSTITNPVNSEPQYNVNADRQRFRFRVRVGAGIDLNDGFSAGVRIGTGQDNSPTTENQTIGLANNGQGGDFSKYEIWLDRGFLRYDMGDDKQNFSITAGRFDNPFLSSSMIWAPDIGFDGIAFQGHYEVTDGVTPFLTAGFFPVFNTDFNFSTDQSDKYSSEDKYLYALQIGTAVKITKDLNAKAAATIYYFDNIEGKLSDPFVPLSSSQQGDTDDSRPSFAQNGNTYMEIRDILPVAANGNGTEDQFQYFGLATPFHEAAFTGQLDYGRFDPFHLQMLFEYVNNFAWDQNSIEAVAFNNRGSGASGEGTGAYNGGNSGYNVKLTIGAPVLQKKWDWNVSLTYRYVESDATVDGFTDSDFGGPLAGTNLQGYIISGGVALNPHVSLALTFMSADSIAGPTYHEDLLQFDVNAKF